jgi:hypothetical protein
MAELTCQPRHTRPARLGSRKPNPEILLLSLDPLAQDLFPSWLAYSIFLARPFSAWSNRILVEGRLSLL